MTYSGRDIHKAVGDSSLEFKRTSAENCKLYAGKDFVPLVFSNFVERRCISV